MRSRIDRYVAREILGPQLVAFVAYTGFMLIRSLFLFSDLVLQSSEPWRQVGFIVAFSVPHIAVLTIPVSLLLGLLIGVGRLSADSELIALRASGVDLGRLFRPIALISLACAVTTLWVMLTLVPGTNRRLYEKKLEASTAAITQGIQPGVFSPEVRDIRIYVENASADRRTLNGVIVADRSDPAYGIRLTLARRGFLEIDPTQGQLWLRLQDSVTHIGAPGAERYDRLSNEAQKFLLVDTNPTMTTTQIDSSKQLREQSLSELVKRARNPRDLVDSRLTRVEIHKKFALPAACLVFGLIGLPLGIVNRRGGRAAGFAVSIGIVLVYYVLMASGEARAIEGTMTPLLAMWLPNLVLVLLGLAASIQVRRDRSLFALPLRLSPKSRQGSVTREPDNRSSEAPATSSSLAERLTTPGRMLDLYVTRRFLWTLALVMTSIGTLYVVIDFMEISDDIAKTHPSFGLLFRFFQARLAPIVLDVVPFAFLVSALVTIVSLVKSSETTAVMSHGVSLFRFTAPLAAMAALGGAGLFVFADRVVPKAAVEADRYRREILGRAPLPRPTPFQTWFRGEEGRFFYVEDFNPETRAIRGLSLIVIDRAAFRIVKRIDAPLAEAVARQGFRVQDAWTRTFGVDGETLLLRQEGPGFVTVPEGLRTLIAGARDPGLMSNVDLARFIDARRRSGAQVARLETGLYQRASVAAAALVLTLLGLPFAVRHGRRGAVAGVGIALLVGLGYIVVSSILVKFGESGSLSPVLAAWGANAFFGLVALHGLLGVRT